MPKTCVWENRVLKQAIENLGGHTIQGVWRIGFAARFFVAILLHSGTAFRRFGLTIREMYFSGVLSLIIILVSGLFVGMVLGLQGYETLQTYGAEESLGILVALSLVRELGPGWRRCCSPAAPDRPSRRRSA